MYYNQYINQSNNLPLIFEVVNTLNIVWYKFLRRANIVKIDKFLAIIKIFSTKYSTVSNVILATVQSMFYSSNFSQCQFVNIFPCQKFAHPFPIKVLRSMLVMSIILKPTIKLFMVEYIYVRGRSKWTMVQGLVCSNWTDKIFGRSQGAHNA